MAKANKITDEVMDERPEIEKQKEAITTVYNALEGLPKVSQVKIIKAVSILLDIDIVKKYDKYEY